MTHAAPKDRREFAAVRRWLLVTLLGGVVGLSILGAAAILFAIDSSIVERVFGTAGVLAGLAIFSLILLALFDRRLIDRWFLWATLPCWLALGLLLVLVIWDAFSQFSDEVAISWFASLGAGALATPCAIAMRLARGRFICIAGLALIAATFAWTLADSWLFNFRLLFGGSSWTHTLTNVMWILAFVPAHTGLTLLIEARRTSALLRWSTIGAGALVGACVAAHEGFNIDSDLFARSTAILTVLATCLTLVTAVIARLTARGRRAAAGAETPIELICPACQSTQSLHSGDSACSQCGCGFNIRITPRNCLSCGYSLADLRERRCPECGVTF